MGTHVVDVKMRIRCTVSHDTDTCYTINTHEIVNEIYIVRLNSRVELIRMLVLTKLIFVSFSVHHFCSELVSDCTSIYNFQQAVGNEIFLDNQQRADNCNNEFRDKYVCHNFKKGSQNVAFWHPGNCKRRESNVL
jgi:hypothetical protein